MDIKSRLKKDIWESDDYYDQARQASLDTNHPAMKWISVLARKSEKILDLGCGEGTRLNIVSQGKKTACGVDISKKAIDRARADYSHLSFKRADLESLPYEDNTFDFIFSAFVFEHLINPEQVLKEAFRVLQEKGSLIITAPNYGAPNRCSPVFIGSRIKKLILGLIFDVVNIFQKPKSLNWLRVEPLARHDNYQSDLDTTIEPYLGSLITYLRAQSFVVVRFSSCWSEEMPNVGLMQQFVQALGRLRIFPFVNWGPHLLIEIKK